MKSKPLPAPARREGPCSCRYEWRDYPRSQWFGAGWWRVSTDPNCVEHGDEYESALTTWRQATLDTRMYP